MTFIKKPLFFAIATLMLSLPVRAGIPVVDVPGNVQNAIAQATNIAQFVQQVETLKNQWETAKEQLDALKGSRGMTALLNDPLARHYLPYNAKGLFSADMDSQNLHLAEILDLSEAAYDTASERFTKFEALVNKVDFANDPKAAMDLQNRIQAEQVMMQNENAKLAMLKNLSDIKEKQIIQKGLETISHFGGSSSPVYANSF